MTTRSMLQRLGRIEKARAPKGCAQCHGNGGVPAFVFDDPAQPARVSGPTRGEPCRACGRPGPVVTFHVVRTRAEAQTSP